MNFTQVLKFFVKEIDLKTWLKVIINFIFHFSIIISEILFLSTFFVILNNKTDSALVNKFFEKLESYFFKFFDTFSVTEIYIVILIFFLLIKNILTISHSIYYNSFIFNLSVKKSSEILRSYMNKSFEDFSKKEISIYIKQLVRDVENVFVGIFGLIVTFISELIYVVILVYFISNLVEFNPTYDVYFALLVMLLILYILYIYAKKYGELRGSTEIVVFKTLNDTLNIFKEIKLFGNSKDFVNRYYKFLDKYFKTRVASGVINLSPKFMFELFLLIFFFIIFKNESSELNINEFVIKYSVFALALLRLIPSFAKLSSYFSVILYNLKSIDFIRNDLKKNSKLDLKKSFRTIRANNIQLSNIYLNYINKKGTKISSKFKNLNLNFSKDNIYGIYGASGSGKTSILNLISGFIKPSKGKVLFNNKEYSLLNITKNFNIGYASQTPTIIDENVIINTVLRYENSKQKIDHLKKYLKIFNLEKFAKNKYFTNKSISSIKNMSGGEKQRIGLIRALINNPDLILLDEPTSSLDKKNEKKVLEFLRSIKKDKIIIITSHKFEHKKYFDKIINL
jgi:ABC-type transport system involved in cytochrome bd biosynthesis fused ATPase/permease subunit